MTIRFRYLFLSSPAALELKLYQAYVQNWFTLVPSKRLITSYP
ncbi:protein of unknown function [Shewanella benthica]|uniref:Uncharacterized protein n=1 Tax=Shewanella benthica TaxID=43661 RepID=A0A330M2V3_9GAMM|nr:protein of unknown function [Shewanella benthica]